MQSPPLVQTLHEQMVQDQLKLKDTKINVFFPLNYINHWTTMVQEIPISGALD